MFSQGTAPDAVEALGAAMRVFHPTGLRAMARASAENLRIEAPEAFNQAVRAFLQGL